MGLYHLYCPLSSRNHPLWTIVALTDPAPDDVLVRVTLQAAKGKEMLPLVAEVTDEQAVETTATGPEFGFWPAHLDAVLYDG